MNAISYSKLKSMSPQLLVTDIDKSLEFYTKKLGFNVSFRHDDFYCGIVKDGFSIHLKSGKPALEERENKKNNEHLDILFSVEGIEGLYEDFTNKSVEVIQPLRKISYGMEFYITDPEGYIIGFLQENFVADET